MRLQLDSTSAAGPADTALADIGQAAPAGGSGADSNRVASGLSGGGDSIQISGASNALSRLAADRAAQIQQLSSAVQDGSYQVSGSLVGSAIVEHAIT
jgi:anti-sigma28 factor (negative regulator of flagellin synthesis)